MSEFVAHIVEMFEPVRPLSPRRMFGGHGLFHEGLMIGLVADDALYLKADSQSALEFEAQGLARFEYTKRGKTMSMSFYLAPEDMLEDPEILARWARLAFDAALRSRDKRRR